MKDKKSGLISSGIFTVIIAAFTPEANLAEDIMLFCLIFIAYCKCMEKD